MSGSGLLRVVGSKNRARKPVAESGGQSKSGQRWLGRGRRVSLAQTPKVGVAEGRLGE